MKKSILILMISAMLLAGCNGGDTPAESSTVTTAPVESGPVLEKDGDTFVITEEKFLEGVREIYGNTDAYIGKRIRFEGEYIAELFGSEMYYQVYRTITVTERHKDEDGHVHTHASQTADVGFRIRYDKNGKPSNYDFVLVEGVVETYEANGETLIIVNADILKKTDGENVHLKY